MQPTSSHSGQKAERIVACNSTNVRNLRLTANVLLQRWRQWMNSHPKGGVASAVAFRAAVCQVLVLAHTMHFNLHHLSVDWKRSRNRSYGRESTN